MADSGTPLRLDGCADDLVRFGVGELERRGQAHQAIDPVAAVFGQVLEMVQRRFVVIAGHRHRGIAAAVDETRAELHGRCRSTRGLDDYVIGANRCVGGQGEQRLHFILAHVQGLAEGHHVLQRRVGLDTKVILEKLTLLLATCSARRAPDVCGGASSRRVWGLKRTSPPVPK